MIIAEIIRDIKDKGSKYDLQRNKCSIILKNNLNQKEVPTDVFLSAKAFTSLLNTIVNNKIDYILDLMSSHSELLSFLETFDDKYLSSASNLLYTSLIDEVSIMDDLYNDIQHIYTFLENFLIQLKCKRGEYNG